MYKNVDAFLLWLRLPSKYLINECNQKKGRPTHAFSIKKCDIGRLELVMSVHVDDAFMAGKRQTLEKIKDNIRPIFNIQYYREVKKFLRVQYEWGRDAKGSYKKMTMEKDVRKLVEDYEKNNGGDVKVQETPGTPGTTPSKSDVEEPQDINNYR